VEQHEPCRRGRGVGLRADGPETTAAEVAGQAGWLAKPKPFGAEVARRKECRTKPSAGPRQVALRSRGSGACERWTSKEQVVGGLRPEGGVLGRGEVGKGRTEFDGEQRRRRQDRGSREERVNVKRATVTER
jgi:hypothetical protein